MNATATFNIDGSLSIRLNNVTWTFKSVSKAVKFCNKYSINAKIVELWE